MRAIQANDKNWDRKIYKKTVRRAKARRALCNDGSNAVYYIRPGKGAGLKRWVIHFEGGGGCKNETSCENRWAQDEAARKKGKGKNHRMSSRAYPSTLDKNAGVFNASRTKNPRFSQWTMVQIRYCSSDSYSMAGQTIGRFQMNGQNIAKAVYADLLSPRKAEGLPSLKDATEVLLAGSSAGAGGVRYTGSHLRKKLRKTTKLFFLLDSGNSEYMKAKWLEALGSLNAPAPTDAASQCAKSRGLSHIPLDCTTQWQEITALQKHGQVFVFQDLKDSHTIKGFESIFQTAGADRATMIRTGQKANRHLCKQSTIGSFCPNKGQHTGLVQDARFFRTQLDGRSYRETLERWLR